MTLDGVVKQVLRRTGLSETSGTFRDNARDYVNQTVDDMVGRAEWFWLRKTASLTTSATIAGYALASDVLSLRSMRHHDDDIPMTIVAGDFINLRDPNRSEAGSPRYVAITGYSSADKANTVELAPVPDATEVIKYDYIKHIADFESDDMAGGETQSLDLDTILPNQVQSALIYGAAALYEEEKGDDEAAVMSRARQEGILRTAERINGQMLGNSVTRTHRRDQPIRIDPFQPAEGSLA